MESEKFQDLVLNHLTQLTQDITEIKGGQQRMESNIRNLRESQQQMDSRINNLESKVDVIQVQTAELTEFRTEVRQGFTEQKESIQALVDMYGQHEFELAKLRRRPV